MACHTVGMEAYAEEETLELHALPDRLPHSPDSDDTRNDAVPDDS